MKAILYIAHGSRRAAANAKFIAFIQKVMQRSPAVIQAFGFLEHTEPSVTQAIETCIGQGASEITVVPVFLLPGIHTNVDIPAELERYPDSVCQYGKPLGVEDVLVSILVDRLGEAGFGGLENETVLLVGHGSRVTEAAIEFERLASNLAEKMACKVLTAFVTTPPFYQGVAGKLADQKIYILPYFLFSGGYTVKMEKELDGDVVFCEPIGFDEKLIPLIEKRATEVEHEFKLSDYDTA
ncbi:sirohydrochlorin chelatase [Neobacillus sp. MM2021_6]|uniref:sirohydrochlorin chelatase n=1 Tax=Bacillaceae TaxID=186817 RepID=UPI001408D332|nr:MULTISPECIES: sirohydrochlorin chelatase [Bacillaceae]MBO0959287.1 sirohydrochlorin chelatase [Neobacillus sp. MM2021_6]NHC20606.1 sirohydrochlorin chelatase [Bacillus sp. MM2020_4]